MPLEYKGNNAKTVELSSTFITKKNTQNFFLREKKNKQKKRVEKLPKRITSRHG